MPILALLIAGIVLDGYVLAHWARFARCQPRLRWTIPLYIVLGVVIPVALFWLAVQSNWWTVEPKGLRRLLVGGGLVWYAPKVIIAFFLLLSDLARFVTFLFKWFKKRLHPAQAESPETALDLTDLGKMSRREFVEKAGWTAASVPFVIVGERVFRGLYDFTVFREDVFIPDLPRQLEGLRIAQLSDLHAGSLFSDRPMLEAVGLVNEEKPDLITITGDYVNHDHREAPVLLPALDQLRAPLGVYGSLGNHDHYADVNAVSRQIDATVVDLLVNDGRTLRIDGADLHVLGTDNTGFGQNFGDLGLAKSRLDMSDRERATILLAHDPTFWDKEVRPGHADIDLTLSGHTHGGQLGVEIGPIRWSPARAVYKRWAGLYTEDPTGQASPDGLARRQALYVNRGLGTVGPPVRFGIKPEITILTLRKAPSTTA